MNPKSKGGYENIHSEQFEGEVPAHAPADPRQSIERDSNGNVTVKNPGGR